MARLPIALIANLTMVSVSLPSARADLNEYIRMECGSNPVLSYIKEIKKDVIDPQILAHAKECAGVEANTTVYKWRLADAGIQGCLEREYKYTPEYIQKIAPLIDDAQENTQGIMDGYNQCVNNMYRCGARFCREKKTPASLNDTELDAKKAEIVELSQDYAELREAYLAFSKRHDLKTDSLVPIGQFDQDTYDRHLAGKLAVMGGQMQGVLLMSSLMPVVQDISRGSKIMTRQLSRLGEDSETRTALLKTARAAETRSNALLLEMVDLVQNARR